MMAQCLSVEFWFFNITDIIYIILPLCLFDSDFSHSKKKKKKMKFTFLCTYAGSQELSQLTMLSFARQIAIGMVSF